MPIDKTTALNHIDSIFKRRRELGQVWYPESISEITTLYCTAIRRLSPPGSPYIAMMERAFTAPDSHDFNSPDERLEHRLQGIVNALRADLETDRLQTFREAVHSELFSDFLEMAEYLMNDEGLKDPAAVLSGGVLEEHLRKLCGKHGIPITFVDSKGKTQPKKLDLMNADLAKAGAYGLNEQKQITAWAGIRNDAAHANYSGYSAEQVKLMIQGIRHFLTCNPA